MLVSRGPAGAGDALWDGVCAVVPAGGAGRRLGGADKPAVLVGGRSLLAHVLGRLPAGVPVAVVGPERHGPADAADAGGGARVVLTCREDPPGGGPAAAVAAGLAALEGAGLLGRVVVVVPADAPRAPEALPGLLDALRRGAPEVTTAVALDGGGHRQVLVAAHDAVALRERVAALGDPAGVAASRLLPRGPALAEVPAPAELLADVDTPADLDAARAAHRAQGDRPA
ncbi:NTP transferase domain-containing protein [Quadrisphaera sp. INWT6]|uniref:NTP transferase domain-containing protein n=1 Tax=Quadrisphaera sp. INWT6 TaxID=2596917 RepID=UPI0018926137|nr:NTP transferase domain-containing protein [Quadrisphaera sp. INWT6]MBF5083170.1 NTP transferase domain-containing protein [Quadrisphaera sp. INWT6]